MFLNFSVDKTSHLAEDFQPLVVSGVGGEEKPQPGEQQRCYQNLGGENENQIVEKLLGRKRSKLKPVMLVLIYTG